MSLYPGTRGVQGRYQRWVSSLEPVLDSCLSLTLLLSRGGSPGTWARGSDRIRYLGEGIHYTRHSAMHTYTHLCTTMQTVKQPPPPHPPQKNMHTHKDSDTYTTSLISSLVSGEGLMST